MNPTRAHTAVQMAINSGALVRPSQCQACGRDGLKIHGHHRDYSKPLDVEWLCPKCHGAAHRAMRNRPPHKTAGILMNQQLASDIDEWRRQQPDLPNRSEAIRRLIDLGIETARQKKSAPKQ